MNKNMMDATMKEWLEAVRSPDPNPGGGGVCAFIAATSSGLTEMVYRLSQGKKKYEMLEPSIKEALTHHVERLQEINERLAFLMEEDGRSFDGVLEAFRLPKEKEEEILFRNEKIQEGYRYAIEIPFEIADLALEILKITRNLADYGTITAITDVAISGLMLQGAVEGVLYNVTINLKGVTDMNFKEICQKRQTLLLEESKQLRMEIQEVVRRRLEG